MSVESSKLLKYANWRREGWLIFHVVLTRSVHMICILRDIDPFVPKTGWDMLHHGTDTEYFYPLEAIRILNLGHSNI